MSRLKSAPTRLQAGFSLVEISFVMVIIGLLMGIFIGPLQSQSENQKRAETRRLLQEAQEALIGFAASNNGRLPRPAADVNGVERAGNCSATDCYGFLPWATLGITGTDGFSYVLRYKVYSDFANTSVKYLNTPTLRISTAPAAAANIDNAAFVLIATAKRNGGISKNSTPSSDACTPNADEQANLTGDNAQSAFSHNLQDDTNLAGGCFDDIVTWVANATLYSRLATQGIFLNN
ncbi:MAG: type II secretion system protein [Burkholderiaceae bacterium]|jgi:prepilin-type N-terminal cleavage/methylation domain-containing protein